MKIRNNNNKLGKAYGKPKIVGTIVNSYWIGTIYNGLTLGQEITKLIHFVSPYKRSISRATMNHHNFWPFKDEADWLQSNFQHK